MIPGYLQIIVIIILVILLFGAGRLPRIMSDLAQGIKSFKKGMRDDDTTSSSENSADPPHIPKQIPPAHEVRPEENAAGKTHSRAEKGPDK